MSKQSMCNLSAKPIYKDEIEDDDNDVISLYYDDTNSLDSDNEPHQNSDKAKSPEPQQQTDTKDDPGKSYNKNIIKRVEIVYDCITKSSVCSTPTTSICAEKLTTDLDIDRKIMPTLSSCNEQGDNSSHIKDSNLLVPQSFNTNYKYNDSVNSYHNQYLPVNNNGRVETGNILQTWNMNQSNNRHIQTSTMNTSQMCPTNYFENNVQPTSHLYPPPTNILNYNQPEYSYNSSTQNTYGRGPILPENDPEYNSLITNIAMQPESHLFAPRQDRRSICNIRIPPPPLPSHPYTRFFRNPQPIRIGEPNFRFRTQRRNGSNRYNNPRRNRHEYF